MRLGRITKSGLGIPRKDSDNAYSLSHIRSSHVHASNTTPLQYLVKLSKLCSMKVSFQLGVVGNGLINAHRTFRSLVQAIDDGESIQVRVVSVEIENFRDYCNAHS